MNLDALSFDIVAATCSVVGLFVLVLLWGLKQQAGERSARLRMKFGLEYEEAIRQHGSRRRAEAELESRMLVRQ